MADAAERSYKSVGRHLGDDNSLGETDVYTQGSFALGTVIRPISGEDEDYDIDLVCEMKDAASEPASHIKKAVGRSLEGYRKDTEDEGKRCWTFQYDKFHMDVLPCSPDITHCDDDTAIRLTHKNPDGSYSDRYSNPKGYRDWFIAKAGRPYELARSKASSTISCSLEEVPEYSVKSPLQQAVQILKHHRNIMFAGRDDAPISIIITTLAARAYRNEQGTFDAIQGILSRMDQYVECRNGVYRIKNPVDEYENFADKWNDFPEKAIAFYDWLAAAKSDLVDAALSTKGMDKLKEHLGSCMGNRQANAAFKEFGGTLKSRRENGKLFASAAGIAPPCATGREGNPQPHVLRPMRHAARPLSMGQQLFALKHRFPSSRVTHSKGRLTWEATLTPTEGCETYELRLTWGRGRFPEVWARAGALERCEDLGSIPHQFGFDEKSKSVKLCLQRRDWDSGQFIADTYVPWAMEWLVFFELWLATGEWLGGGEHVG